LDDIEVSVKDGVVSLKGTLDNLSHRYVIMTELEKIRGVRRVDVSGVSVKHT